MYYRINRNRLPILLLLVSLTCLIALSLRYPVTATGAPGGSVLRLRVRVQDTSLAADQSTKIRVEFLDGDYQPVANDGTRVVELGQTPAKTGSGAFSKSRITVRPGEPYAETSFTARQPGKLVITASSDGLDSAQTLMIITPHKASFLSRLFETVAYAESEGGLELNPSHFPKSFASDNKVRVPFQITFLPNTRVRISTDLSRGGIFYDGQLVGSSVAEITLDKGGVSGQIGIVSATPGKVEIRVTALLNGPTDGPTERTEINFELPKPTKVLLDGPKTISPDDHMVPIYIQFAGDGGDPLENDRVRHIRLRLVNEDENKDFVTFEPEQLDFPSNQLSAQVFAHVKDLPLGNEIGIFAEAVGENQLVSVKKSIFVKSAIEKLLISGPAVINPRTDAEFIVRFADKEGKPKAADGPRKINLTMESVDVGVETGVLTPIPLEVKKGDDHAVVKYRSPGSVGRFVLSASSSGLENSQYQIRAVTAIKWLVLIALFGGAVGGVARQLKRDLKRKRPLTRRSRRSLLLALKRILGSMVSGLFLYLAYKLGLAQFSGLPALPLDLEGKLIAFFLSGLGGFAGLVVMHQLAARFLKSSPKPKEAVSHGHLAAEAPSRPVPSQTPGL